MSPNFVLLDATLPDVPSLVAAMVQARDAVERRSWAHPQEPTGEEWWADVLTDPRARKARAAHRSRRQASVLSACRRKARDHTCRVRKCDWRAAFALDDLIAAHGADYAMPNLLNHLAAPGCNRFGSHWDRCGVHYVEPVEGSR
jgi:hypothetical protein